MEYKYILHVFKIKDINICEFFTIFENIVKFISIDQMTHKIRVLWYWCKNTKFMVFLHQYQRKFILCD